MLEAGEELTEARFFARHAINAINYINHHQPPSSSPLTSQLPTSIPTNYQHLLFDLYTSIIIIIIITTIVIITTSAASTPDVWKS